MNHVGRSFHEALNWLPPIGRDAAGRGRGAGAPAGGLCEALLKAGGVQGGRVMCGSLGLWAFEGGSFVRSSLFNSHSLSDRCVLQCWHRPLCGVKTLGLNPHSSKRSEMFGGRLGDRALEFG